MLKLSVRVLFIKEVNNIRGIYQIKNIINNKVYIGSSKDINSRWNQHIKRLDGGTHHSYKLQEEWDSFGKDNFVFEMVEEIECNEELLDREQYYLDFYKSYDKGYNILKFSDGRDYLERINIKSEDFIRLFKPKRINKLRGFNRILFDYLDQFKLKEDTLLYMYDYDNKLTYEHILESGFDKQKINKGLRLLTYKGYIMSIEIGNSEIYLYNPYVD